MKDTETQWTGKWYSERENKKINQRASLHFLYILLQDPDSSGKDKPIEYRRKKRGKKMRKKTASLSAMVMIGALLLAGCGKEGFDKTQNIQAYTRDTNSGTREGFMEKIGYKEAAKDDTKLNKRVKPVASNGDMLSALEQSDYGIGYFSFDSKEEAEKNNVKLLNFENVTPSEDSILDGSYKLARDFNYCIAEETDANKKLIVEAFVAFLSTSEGMTTIKSNGGVCKITTQTKSWNEVKKDYPGIEDDHSSITINFGGSTSVEKIAKALSSQFRTLAGNFNANHNHTGSGDAYKKTQGSEKGSLDIGFASRGFHLDSDEKFKEGTYGKICVDGIVIGVSSKNPLENITAEEAKSIYSVDDSTYNTWSALIK